MSGDDLLHFWTLSVNDGLSRLDSRSSGLTSSEARERLRRYGPNRLRPKERSDALTLLLSQFKSPIVLMLIGASILSLALQDAVDAGIILVIVAISGLLGFWQERNAANAVGRLLAIVQVKSEVLRDNSATQVPVEEIVPGDIIQLNAGDIIPADCLLLEAKDLFVDEAALTGETYPEPKEVGVLPADTLLGDRTNCLFMGTHVISGTGTAVAVLTASRTEFGKVSDRLRLRPAETEFERGVRRIGYLIMEFTFVMLVAIFVFNVLLARPVLESFMFALALAVGLTPQLLPAVISVNLAHGARRMAAEKVIVKRLASIENFGSMDVLCSDKTGTLTEGVVSVRAGLGMDGQPCEKVMLYAYLNSLFETGFTSPIDAAIREQPVQGAGGFAKLDEVPYDFVRKRLSILVSHDAHHLMITKGSVDTVLAACTKAESPRGEVVPLEQVIADIQHRYAEYSGNGFRMLGVAWRDMGSLQTIARDDETDMTFLGFIVLHDPPKEGIAKTISDLKSLGISLKVITGDNRLVSTYVSQQIGLTNPVIITGAELREMSDEALRRRVGETHVFAQVEPNQKERIITALRKAGHVVGYLGDGINDASALHAADVGISVDTAVDVAKEAADLVLLQKDLRVLLRGVEEGRRTFTNTLKYVFMATSANFGNMFSMAGASVILPFLPLLPSQILLMNLLTDLPEMTIATDSVDEELLRTPQRWDVRFIRRFMLTFGPLSSLFDFITFGVLMLVLQAGPAEFRSGWFLESVISASLVVLVVRTRRPFFRSMPGRNLVGATLLVVAVALAVPLTPLAPALQFGALPWTYPVLMLAVVGLYMLSAEITKHVFYQRFAVPTSHFAPERRL